MFGRYKIKITNNITLHVLNIEIYSLRLKKYMESSIFQIWNGDCEEIDNFEQDIDITKKELMNLIATKSSVQQVGIVSEFICHLYLRANKFHQHFLFRNLEEKGMKKGFDGLYLNDEKFYIYESKSSLSSTKDATHNKNISEAYNDIRKKIEGTNIQNDPWRNAYNHASLRSINYNENISKTLKQLSKDYVKKKYSKIGEYNLIPSSTIYLDNRYCDINRIDLKAKIESLTTSYLYKSMEIICINKRSVQQFIDYLNE